MTPERAAAYIFLGFCAFVALGWLIGLLVAFIEESADVWPSVFKRRPEADPRDKVPYKRPGSGSGFGGRT